MGFEFDEYLDTRVREAIRCWDPSKPRRWLAKFGDLSGMPSGGEARRYRALRDEARALTARNWLREHGDHMADVTYQVGR